MALKAGFAEVEITPPVGTHKIGWIVDIVIEEIADPLFARIAVIESGRDRVAFVQLDTLCVRWTQTDEMRRRIEAGYGFPGANIMVSATHNHAGPAVATAGDVRRDDVYVEAMVSRAVECFGRALDKMRPAEIGFASVPEWGISHNRRVVMRDGTASTHGRFRYPEALYVEGPIDPEVAVVGARGEDGKLLGALANFACHPTDHGGDAIASGGFPAALAREMKARGCPVTLFLNGAAGNICSGDPYRGVALSLDEMGRALADDVCTALKAMAYTDRLAVGARSRTIQLPYRRVTPEEVAGTVRGAQRFVDPAAYERGMPALLRRIAERKTQPAEVQAVSLGDWALVGVPAEYFVQLGLRIKEEAHPIHALVVSCANGMVGYVPHREAFLRGGYETTFTQGASLAPEAGDMLAEAAVELARGGRSAEGG
ncbi:MAG: neutral/alkaline non-lysosomal ceramidase N-terminal domain-containing protein [Armatimonadota bacterium]